MIVTKDRKKIGKLKKRAQLKLGKVDKNVRTIVDDVKKRGDKAVIAFTKKFDSVILKRIEVTKAEINAAMKKVSSRQKSAINTAIKNIKAYHQAQMPMEWSKTFSKGLKAGQLVRALNRVGCYIPGGRYPLVSTVLMTVVPAKVAGVKEIVICSPPEINPAIIAAAKMAGADRIFKVGGAQAIAAMAYGTKSIPKVDKIVGPGNIYVTAAKKIVYGSVGLDFLAGPSEVMIVADRKANPRFIAADMLAQAEHDIYASAVLVTTSEDIAKETIGEISRQLDKLKTRETAKNSLKNYSAIIVVDRLKDAVEIVNDFAPEHLEWMAKDRNSIKDIDNVGALFIGDYSCESAGDYASGPNHVLPTGGFAKSRAGLSVMDFVKMPTVQELSRQGLKGISRAVIELAETEGLKAHAEAVRKRFKND